MQETQTGAVSDRQDAGTEDRQVDMEAVARTALRLGRKKSLAVARDMLRQQGLNEEAADELLGRWAQTLERPESLGEALEGELETLRGRNRELEDRLLAMEMGIPGDRVERYLKLAASDPQAERSLAQALEAALEEFPLGMGATQPQPLSFAARTAAPVEGRTLTRREIETMSPQELAARWSEVEGFLTGDEKGCV